MWKLRNQGKAHFKGSKLMEIILSTPRDMHPRFYHSVELALEYRSQKIRGYKVSRCGKERLKSQGYCVSRQKSGK